MENIDIIYLQVFSDRSILEKLRKSTQSCKDDLSNLDTNALVFKGTFSGDWDAFSNNMSDVGIYRINGLPVTGSENQWGYLIHLTTQGSSFWIQLFTAIGNGCYLAQRNGNSSGWSAWRIFSFTT